MNIQEYDFREPGRLADEVRQCQLSWQKGLFALLMQRWREELPYEMKLVPGTVIIHRPAEAVRLLPQPALGFKFAVGQTGTPTVIVLSRRTALALAMGLLGDSGEELPEDRDLTSVEQSLVEVIVQEFCAALRQAWPYDEQFHCRVLNVEQQPDRMRLIGPDESLIVSQFEVAGPFGAEKACWLLPQDGLRQLLAHHMPDRTKVDAEARPKLETLVRGVSVGMRVQLGRANLHFSDLANVRIGDLIMLDQKVIEPLVAEIDGRGKFIGWPACVGARQAFQIDSLWED